MKIYFAGRYVSYKEEKRVLRLCKRRLISFFYTLPDQPGYKITLRNFKWAGGINR